MDNMSKEKYLNDTFSIIMERIRLKTGIKNANQLSKIIGISQGTVSRKKNSDIFEVEWAFRLSREFDLEIEWILTGKENKSSFKKNEDFKKRVGDRGEAIRIEDDFLKEVEEWLKELVKEDPEREYWFRCQFKDAFPTFSQWQKIKTGNNSGFNSKIKKVA